MKHTDMIDPPVLPPYCIGCDKPGAELGEYIDAAREEGTDPDTYIRQNEGTYNRTNGHFLCTPCYVKAGMPSGPRGWRAS